MHQADFKTKVAFEIDEIASKAYRLNHPDTAVITKDIRKVSIAEIKRKLKGKTIHLLAGCPPCQGFSSIRRLNRTKPVADDRNNLIMEYVRLVKALKPYTIMMENVPGLIEYDLFKKAIKILTMELNYKVDFKVVNVKNYGVPQSRRRLVLVGSRSRYCRSTNVSNNALLCNSTNSPRQQNKTFDIPTYQASQRRQLIVSLDNIGLEKEKNRIGTGLG